MQRIWRTLRSLAWALLLALAIRTVAIQAYRIPSTSMEPTVLKGDFILAWKWVYGLHLPVLGRVVAWHDPRPGDVIIFAFPPNPHKDFIKRVIAVGGQEVFLEGRRLYIDGRPVPDPHAHWNPRRDGKRGTFGPVVVPRGYLFVMGDNRDASYDSRYWGFVPLGNVKGKAWLVYFSWDSKRHWVRWRRIGHLIR